jgi:nicotinamidase-related amidase
VSPRPGGGHQGAPGAGGRGVRGLGPGATPALVIVECQRGVLDPGLSIFEGLARQCAERGVLGRIAGLAAAFRAAGRPVLHAHVAHRPDFSGAAVTNPITARTAREGRMVAGTAQVEAMPEVAPEVGDHVSTRHSGLGLWYGTDVDSTLRNLRVDTVVLCGVSTNIALFAGALGAVDRGYRAVVVTDASAGASAESHEWMLTNTLPLIATLATAGDVATVVAAGSEADPPAH